MRDLHNARLALFAGTTEGHELCRLLSTAGRRATAFVATEYGAELLQDLPGIDVRAGRLSEAAMEEVLAGGFDVVIDATHPYAAEASANIRAAAEHDGVRYLRLLRPSSREDAESGAPFDDASARIVEVTDAAAAVRFLARTEGRVLLTTGSKDLPTFATLPDFVARLYARILPDPAALARARELGFAPAHLICMQGPFPREMNVATLRMVGAHWMVTKDAGAPGGMPAKIEAAREAGVGLVVLARPPEPGVTYTFEQVCAALGLA
ncbi:MAG: precorrin-6A reductase [Coriobacteriia bacterium]|nr:precorrin-6A reductase [Coriobacteriia bacterium]MBS5477360.1 precorrin-6A reductase [Coriobacteriia bacterium]